MNDRHVAVYGAGAIGCGIAAALAANGTTPTLVSDWAEHVQALRSTGLRVRRPDGTVETYRVRATTTTGILSAGPVHVAYIAVKCQGTGRYASLAAGTLAEDGVAVSMQNGVTVDELVTALGPSRVLGGSPNFSAERTGPGAIRRMGSAAALVVGELDGTRSVRVTALAELTDGHGWTTTVSGNVRGLLWAKMIANSMVNALCALGGFTVGELMEHPVARRISVQMLVEGGRVARAAGIRLEAMPTMDIPAAFAVAEVDPAAAEEYHRAFGRVFPDARVSTLQDVEAGRPTELAHLTGFVVEQGARLGVPTPVSAAVLAAAEDRARGAATPPSIWTDLLAVAAPEPESGDAA